MASRFPSACSSTASRAVLALLMTPEILETSLFLLSYIILELSSVWDFVLLKVSLLSNSLIVGLSWLWTVLTCLVKVCFCLKLFWQMPQQKLQVRICFSANSLLWNLFLHVMHENCSGILVSWWSKVSKEWDFRWRAKFVFGINCPF